MNDVNNCEKKGIGWACFWLSAAVLYAISPVDLIPDVPVVGWIDDIAILLPTTLNAIEKSISDTSSSIRKTVHLVKWIFILLGVLVCVLGVAALKYIFS